MKHKYHLRLVWISVGILIVIVFSAILSNHTQVTGEHEPLPFVERIILPVFVPLYAEMELDTLVITTTTLITVPYMAQDTWLVPIHNTRTNVIHDNRDILFNNPVRSVPEEERILFNLDNATSDTLSTDPIVDPSIPQGKVLVVDQSLQLLRVYEDNVQVRALPISSGLYPYYTPAHRGYVGHYAPTIYGYGTLADHAWYLFEARGNIYLHGAPYTLQEGGKIYQDLEFIGVKAVSHGCIRLMPEDAEWLTDWGPGGAYFIVTEPVFSAD